MAIAVLSGCTSGPDFRPPPLPSVDHFTREPVPPKTVSTNIAGGDTQTLEFGKDLPAQWWALFSSPKLNALIDEAMRNYPDIAAQQAALRAALDRVQESRGAFFPQVQGAASYTREKLSGAEIGPGYPGFITNVYQASVNVSYTFDLFGGERRALEGARARALEQNFKLQASYLTLTANVASIVIQLASLRGQIAATQEIIGFESKQQSIIKRQAELGSRTRADVLQQEASVASVRATLPTLQQSLAVTEHKLAVLTGHTPAELSATEIDLSDLTLPQDLPISVPSSLTAQRPDIRAQEAALHAASSAIGVATANMLPQLTLTGTFGSESLTLDRFLASTAGTWRLAEGIVQPLFEGGALRAARREAIDSYEETAAEYRLVVLQAFQNVADTLTALDNDARALREQHEAVYAAQDGLEFIRKQYDDGAASYVSLLAAQQTHQQARIAHIRAVAQRYTDTVALFQALGGGWWNRNDPGSLGVNALHERNSATAN